MKSINLPAYLERETTREGTTYYAGLVHERPAISVLAYSEKDARAKLVKDIEEKLTTAVEHDRYSMRYIIGTGSGDVLIVSYRGGKWSYDICGSGRPFGSVCITQADYRGTIEQAVDHANQSYGGVVYEHSF